MILKHEHEKWDDDIESGGPGRGSVHGENEKKMVG